MDGFWTDGKKSLALNKQAQAGAFASFVVFFLAVAIYFLSLAKYVNEYMDEKVAAGALAGVEGFFFANFNFFVGVICILILLLMARYA